jgi:hypothetical protein
MSPLEPRLVGLHVPRTQDAVIGSLEIPQTRNPNDQHLVSDSERDRKRHTWETGTPEINSRFSYSC